MSNRAEQIENGELKKMVSRKQRKILKKNKRKKLRKVKIDDVPGNNKYNGWVV
jgi:hypothetical protein